MIKSNYIGVHEDLPKHCNPWDIATVNGKNYIFSGSHWFDTNDVAFADIGTDDKLISFEIDIKENLVIEREVRE